MSLVACLRSLSGLLLLAASTFSSPLLASTSSLWLDGGAERVAVAHDPRLHSFRRSIAAEAWVRPDSVSGCRTIVGKGRLNGYWFGLCDGALRLYTGNGQFREAGTVPVAQWTHVAVSYSGTLFQAWVNGTLVSSVSATLPFQTNARALGIGAEGSSPTYPLDMEGFDGRLAEVRLWTRQITTGEVRLNLYRQLTEPEDGLLAVWALEGDGLERFGRFSGDLVDGASVSSLDAPPFRHAPAPIPPRPSGSSLVINGVCDETAWQSARTVPTFYSGAPLSTVGGNPQPVLMMANASRLYFCLRSRPVSTDQMFEVRIDGQLNAGSRPSAGDYLFRVRDSGLEVFEGNGNLSSPWSPIPIPSGTSFGRASPSEFDWEVELSIPRSLVPAEVFGLSLKHRGNYFGNSFASGWPDDFGDVSPFGWEPATVDTTAAPHPDSRVPRVELFAPPTPLIPGTTRQIRIRAEDDIGLEYIELLVNGTPVGGCEVGGIGFLSSICGVDWSFAAGRHQLQARAFDHGGLSSRSNLITVRAARGSQGPKLRLQLSNPRPGLGQPVTVTAHATDPEGVRSVTVREPLGLTFPSFRRCDFPAGQTAVSCSFTITPPAGARRLLVDAFATDDDEFRTQLPERSLVFGFGGVDSDGDDLDDALEALLCTDPMSPDTDRDGLPDNWELRGIVFADGNSEPITDYGAHPCRADVLAQIDIEDGAPAATAWADELRNEFRSQGVNLYLETHERPATTAFPQSHLSAEEAAIQTRPEGGYYFAPARTWAFRYGYNRPRIGSGAAYGRYYTVEGLNGSSGFCFGGSGAGNRCSIDRDCGSGGTCGAGCAGGSRAGLACTAASDCPAVGGEFASCDMPCSRRAGDGLPACWPKSDTGPLNFHELGHTIGLGHGGAVGSRAPTATGGVVRIDQEGRGDNYRPNHLSIMNYLYPSGMGCFPPIPASPPSDYFPPVVNQMTYSRQTMPSLNNDSLDERTTSAFATALRSYDCSDAGPDAYAAITYTCRVAGKLHYVVTDGRRTLGQRPIDGWYDFARPFSHPPGIDWNCDGLIQSSVTGDINAFEVADAPGPSPFAGPDDWLMVPVVQTCQGLYTLDCANPSRSCYVLPQTYRNAIPTLDTGVAPLDCRRRALDVRTCPGIPESSFPTSDCPGAPTRDSAGVLLAKGFTGPGATGDEHIPEEFTLPGSERCDGLDNDGDGQVDERCADDDNDAVPDRIDNCPGVSNPDQDDSDGDRLGDACENPGISGLIATLVAPGQVRLSWQHDAVPAIGVDILRWSAQQPTPAHRGAPHPSSGSSPFVDAVDVGGDYTWSVGALDLDGQPGPKVNVSLSVADPSAVFADGFEQ